MTDNEIIKALKELLEIMLCEGDLQRSATISKALDLINRQKGTVEGLRDEIEHLHEVIDDLYETIEGWDI